MTSIQDLGEQQAAGWPLDQMLCRRGANMRYAIAIEPGENNYSAYAPDAPGCVATGVTVEEVTSEIRDALAAHLRPRHMIRALPLIW